MKVNSIHNHNLTFGAKLNVCGKFFVKDELDLLNKKADKIGFENDVIELNYTNYRDKSIEFFNVKQPDYLKSISSTLIARFLSNGEGKGTEFFRESVSGDSYKEFWRKENGVANWYLDRLIERYPNKRVGVCIIEN